MIIMDSISETRFKLKSWDKGSTESEGLAAIVLSCCGYEQVDPIHPLGGPDGGKDIICFLNGRKWIGAVYFPTQEKLFADIKSKFIHDLKGVEKNGAYGIAFVTNQKLSDLERVELRGVAKENMNVEADIFHLERLVTILNWPHMYGTRLKFLEIPISKEEEIAYLESVNKKQYDSIQKRIDDLYRYIRSDKADEEFWEFSSRSEEEISAALKEMEDKVWYQRHLFLKYRLENGLATCDEEVWKRALKAADRVVDQYGENELGPYTDFEWGMINGKLSALRWLLGDEWDMLDT